MTGIYKITNQVNGKVYIGQSKDIKARWRRHRTAAFAEWSNQYDSHLYRSIRKYGLDNFRFEVIEECLIADLNDRESYWIKYYNSTDINNGYNMTIEASASGTYQKLNPQAVKDIREALLNSEILLKDLAKKYNVTAEAITDINQGHSFREDEFDYPLRKRNFNNNKCICCGKLISLKAVRCEKCSHEHMRKVVRPSREELKELIRTTPFLTIAKSYNVTDNAIRRWCDEYKLPRKKNEIKKYSDEEWNLI